MFAVTESNRSTQLHEPDDAPQASLPSARIAAVNTVSAYPLGFDPDTAHAVDHGGRILKHVDVAPVYLGDYWKTSAGASDRKFNDGAMANLVKNKGMTGLWKQYGAGAGTTHGSVAVGAGNPRQMTQAQVAALVKAQIASGTLDASKRERVFMVVLPPGCELVANHGESSRNGLGGFHGSVTVGGREVYYAALAYPKRTASGTNGIDFAGNARDNLSIAESHEITEAVTDPDVELAMRLRDPSKLGWYDDVTRWGYTHTGKGEIGDIPVINAQLRGDRTLRSAWGRSDGYAFQKEWSERDGVSELGPGRG
jgi:hypothetical protein